MALNVNELKAFYGARGGRLVRRVLGQHIGQLWPDTKGLSILGCGYAVPFLKRFEPEAERVCAVMMPETGVHRWPLPERGNVRVCLADGGQLPLESESIDRALVVHGLEFSQAPDLYLQELWRVLRSNGRLLLVVPNRLGLWARADWTPFGHGQPYSLGQVMRYLQDNRFVQERRDYALFMPPFRSFLVLRTAYTMEGMGRYLFPGLAGVHLIEVSKQVYAGRRRAVRKMEKLVDGKPVLVAKPVPTGYSRPSMAHDDAGLFDV